MAKPKVMDNSPQTDRHHVSPTSIRLEASTFCQLKCPTCETATGELYKKVPKGFLRFEQFEKLLNETSLIESVELSNFGEVFLNPHLSRILEFAHAKGVSITMSNGVNLNTVREGTLEDLVRYQVRHMLCSIDGASHESYSEYRRNGDFDTVMSNIGKINDFKRKHQSEFPKLTWQFVVFGHNEHEIAGARKLASELDMDFTLKLNWDDSYSPVRDKEKVRREVTEGVTSRREYEETNGEPYLANICNQLWRNPQVNFDGTVWGCCRNNWKPFNSNVFDDGYENAINSEQMRYARSMLRDNAPARDDIPCTTCSLYKKLARQKSQTEDRS